MNFFEKAIFSLLETEPYYAHFILNSRIMYDKLGVETAGAGVIGGSTTLIFNTKFMESLTKEECTAVLKHEVLHLCLDHNFRIKPDKEDKLQMLKHHVANVAMDCAINQYIKDIPKMAVTLQSVREITKKPDLEAFQTAEYYYDAMKEHMEEIEQKLKAMDDHGLEIPGDQKGTAMGEAVVGKTAEAAFRQSAGKISGELSKVLQGLLSGPTQVNWKQLLRNFVASSRNNTKIATRKRLHRRFDEQFPGKKIKRELVLGVCVDTSGSVGDDEFASLMKEVTGMMANVTKIYLIQADSEVKKVETLKKKSDIKLERSGYGGTAYQPAITKCKELRCDAIVYLGDMDSSDVPENPGVPFLWVTVRSEKKPGDFGYMIKIETEKAS